MSRFNVTVLPDAEAEMREAFLWYFDRSPLIADGFGTEVAEAIDKLEDTASDWPEGDGGVRFYHLKHFPHTIWYEIAGNEVVVLAVAHQRRKPGYWQSR